MSSFQTRIVGTRFYTGADSIISTLSSEDELRLVREPENEYDKFAVAVYHDDRKLGHIPRTNSQLVFEMIEYSLALPVASVVNAGKPDIEINYSFEDARIGKELD